MPEEELETYPRDCEWWACYKRSDRVNESDREPHCSICILRRCWDYNLKMHISDREKRRVICQYWTCYACRTTKLHQLEEHNCGFATYWVWYHLFSKEEYFKHYNSCRENIQARKAEPVSQNTCTFLHLRSNTCRKPLHEDFGICEKHALVKENRNPNWQ